MSNLKGSRTEKNLREAFSGESMANRTYLAFAKKAELEGLKQVAKLFRAAAAAETVHAHSHLRALGDVETTAENLRAAIAGETHECTEMYPKMIEDATNEGFDDALKGLIYANEVEKIHADLYQKALNSLGKTEAAIEYYVCQVCGNTIEGEPDGPCEVCGAAKAAFMHIE